jgi:hypothetical protein
VRRPSFFEGWDSTVVSRAGFLADYCSALFIECTDDPHHPPLRLRSGRLFSQSARKGWGTRQVVGKRPFGRAISLGRQTGRSPWNPAPCTKRKERATRLPKVKGKGSGQECPLYTTLGGRGAPTLRFLKGGIPRSSLAWDLLLTPAVPSFIERT